MSEALSAGSRNKPVRRTRSLRARDFVVLCASFIAILLLMLVTGAVGLVEAVAGAMAALAVTAAYYVGSAAVTLPDTEAESATANLPPGPAASVVPLKSLPLPAFEVDLDQRIVAFNDEAEEVLRVNGRVRPRASTLIRSPVLLSAIDEAIRTPSDVPAAVEVEAGPDETWRAHVSRPLQAERILVVLEDLTPLRRAARSRSDFIANASHELRTPLASLAGFIETLQGSARDDAGARERFLDIMRAQAFRMSRLIDDLMSLSRIELDAHLRPSAPVDIGDIVSHVADSLKPLAEAEGTAIRLQRPEGPLLVSGERDELVQVFQNLIENAIKYGASGGPVDVAIGRAGPQGQRVEIAVRDHGPGIAPEHVPRLTERFYRVDEAHSREKGGTGLGLAIVKHILNRHRGTLDVASKPNEGSCFTVRLELANVTGERPPEPGIPGTKEK